MYNNRTDVFGNEKFNAYLTIEEDGVKAVFFHLTVTAKLTKQLISEVKDVFLETCAYLDAIGYDRIYVHTPDKRFCKLIMGETYTELGCVSGKDLLVWEFEDILWGGVQ